MESKIVKEIKRLEKILFGKKRISDLDRQFFCGRLSAYQHCLDMILNGEE